MPKDKNIFEIVSWLHRIATVEGWLALVIALASWVFALRPVGPMVGMPVEAFLRDIILLFPAVIGFGLGISGIRHGNNGARTAGWCAIVLLLALMALIVSGWVSYSFRA